MKALFSLTIMASIFGLLACSAFAAPASLFG